MPNHEPLFDPLLFLDNLDADVRLVGQGEEQRVVVYFWKGTPKKKREQGMQVAKVYDKLLRLQLQDNPPSSVQKLLAHGKIILQSGRYSLPEGFF